MFKKNVIIGILISLFILTACSDDKLDSFEKTNMIRFEFPQGENSWDQEIKQIAEEWGIYIIYKDYTKEDLNRSWVFSRYNPVYEGDLPSEPEVQIYLNIIKKWVLSTYNKDEESDRSKLPVYFYLVNNYHDADSNYMRLNMKGFDYWSLSFTTEEFSGGLDARYEHSVACTFGYKSILAHLEQEKIISSGFPDMTDYVSSVGSRYLTYEKWKEEYPDKDDWEWKWWYPYQKDPVNVYYKRGFVPEISTTFDEETGCPEWMPLISLEWKTWPPVEERILNDFLNYVRFAMVYTENKVYEKYPVNSEDESLNEANKLIRDKYHFVTEYMRSVYQIDLAEYAGILEN